MRRADDAWAIQMERAPKKRKTLILIGIVCDDEVKDIMDFKTVKDRSKMVLKILLIRKKNFNLILFSNRMSKFRHENVINYH
jgi:hypothetical protein